jgi:hypothetical protein
MTVTVEVRESRRMWASPDSVWQVLRVLNGLPGWIPWVASCRVSGDLRTTIASDTAAAPVVEQIVDFDDGHRAYSYRYLQGPLPLESYVARVQVLPFGPSQCEVIWAGSFTATDPAEAERLRRMVAGTYRRALDGLRDYCVREPDGSLSLPPTLP